MQLDDIYQPKPEKSEFDNDKIKELWPQAAGELRGFARALASKNAGITAAQLRMAIQLAEERYKEING